MADPKNYADVQGTRWARWMLILTAAMWSTSGLFAKAPWLQAWPVESRGTLLAFWRTLFAGLFLLPLVRRPSWTWRLVPTTVIFAAMNVTYLNAMTRTTAANAIWLQNTAPLWVALFGAFVLKTKLSQRELVMLLMGMTGIGIILGFEVTQSEVQPRGIIWGVFGGMTFAAVVLTVRWVRDLDAAWVIVLNHLVTALLLTPYLIHQGVYPSIPQAGFLAAFGVFQLGLPYVLFARCLKHVPSHEASYIILLEPLLVPLWVFLAYHNHASYEAPQWWTWVGATFILAGLLVRYAPNQPSGSSEPSP